MRTVARRQQAARQTLRHRVVAQAGGPLLGLPLNDTGITQHHLSQALVFGTPQSQRIAVNPQGSACALHNAGQGLRRVAQHHRGVEHAFTADQHHLQIVLAFDGQNQRDKTVNGKVGMVSSAACDQQFGVQIKIHQLTVFQQGASAWRRKPGNQLVFQRKVFLNRHALPR